MKLKKSSQVFKIWFRADNFDGIERHVVPIGLRGNSGHLEKFLFWGKEIAQLQKNTT